MLGFLILLWAIIPAPASAQLSAKISSAQGSITCDRCGFGAQTGRGFPLPYAEVGLICQGDSKQPIIVATGASNANGEFNLKTPEGMAAAGLKTCSVRLLDPHGCSFIASGTPNMCPIITYAQESSVMDDQLPNFISVPAPAPALSNFPSDSAPNFAGAYSEDLTHNKPSSFAMSRLSKSAIAISAAIFFHLLCF